jgi:uncharacterized protein (TIGR00369 family)
MQVFQPQDPAFAERVRDSFSRQTALVTIGAKLASVRPGAIEIELPYRADLCQQHGFIHAGIVATIVDTACGYAAFSLMPPDAGVLSIEFKVNLLAPAAGAKLIARGRVKKAGRTITVCEGDVFTVRDGQERLIATMLATMMTILGRHDVIG